MAAAPATLTRNPTWLSPQSPCITSSQWSLATRSLSCALASLSIILGRTIPNDHHHLARAARRDLRQARRAVARQGSGLHHAALSRLHRGLALLRLGDLRSGGSRLLAARRQTRLRAHRR